VLVHQTDVRFRIAGRQRFFDRGAYLIEADKPWRAGFVTYGIYGDGWTRPHTPATVRIFANPGQRTALMRFITVELVGSDSKHYQPVRLSSNLDDWRKTIAPESSLQQLVTVCVPADGYGEVRLETPVVNDIYRDPTKAALTGQTDRPVGMLVRILALADENEPLDACPAEPARS